MRRIAALLLGAAILSACATGRRDPITLIATPQTLTQALQESAVGLTLQDGAEVTFYTPRRFGDAICGDLLCVREAEIKTVTLFGGGNGARDENDNPLLAILAAPVVLAVAVATTRPGQPPTPEQRRAMELDDVASCRTAQTPAAIFNDRDGLIAWAWDNRATAPLDCVQAAAGAYHERAPDRRLELQWFALARGEWNRARCANTVIGFSRLSAQPVGGPQTPGDPALIARARAVISDVFARENDDDLATACANFGGVAPQSAWAKRAGLAKALLDPFSRDAYVLIGNPPNAQHLCASQTPNDFFGGRRCPVIHLQQAKD